MKASFDQSYTVIYINSGIYKNKGTSRWNFVQNSGLWKFCFGISIVEHAINFARLRSTLERDKLDRRLSTDLLSDARPL